MKKKPLYKILLLGIVVLLIGVSLTSSGDSFIFSDDTTPPVTICFLDPPYPDGENGWYVSNVTVTLQATDDISGVKEIYYKINEEPWIVTYGDLVIFVLGHDCLIEGVIEFYAVDFAGNQEDIKYIDDINIDQEPPEIELTYEVIGGNHIDGWDILLTATAFDYCSGLDRAEFYLNDVLQETVTGPGPTYQWTFLYLPLNTVRVSGLIHNLEITGEYVNFSAIIVRVASMGDYDIDLCVYAYDIAGNLAYCCLEQPTNFTITPGFYIFKDLSLPNNYVGHIGKFLIFAKFTIL